MGKIERVFATCSEHRCVGLVLRGDSHRREHEQEERGATEDPRRHDRAEGEAGEEPPVELALREQRLRSKIPFDGRENEPFDRKTASFDDILQIRANNAFCFPRKDNVSY